MSIHYPLFLLIISSVLVQPLTAFTPTQVASIANITPHGGVKQCPSLFASSSSSSDTDLDKTLREELKVQLLASAEEFKSIQQDLNSALISEKRIEADNVKERGYFFKLIRRIIAKIMGKKRKKPRSTSFILWYGSYCHVLCMQMLRLGQLVLADSTIHLSLHLFLVTTLFTTYTSSLSQIFSDLTASALSNSK